MPKKLKEKLKKETQIEAPAAKTEPISDKKITPLKAYKL